MSYTSTGSHEMPDRPEPAESNWITLGQLRCNCSPDAKEKESLEKDNVIEEHHITSNIFHA